jgi:hypothetical protein
VEEHAEGCRLLLDVLALAPVASPLPANPTRDAIHELVAWHGPGFACARAALRRRFPQHELFVFADLGETADGEVVLSVATFLARLEALRSGPDRVATREEDHAALVLLAARGIDAETCQRLHDLVRAATGIDEAPLAPEDDHVPERERALVELHRWVEEWSTTARAVVKRRDALISLGLAKRRTSSANRAAAVEVSRS